MQSFVAAMPREAASTGQAGKGGAWLFSIRCAEHQLRQDKVVGSRGSIPTSVIQGNPLFTWGVAFVVSQKWSFPTSLHVPASREQGEDTQARPVAMPFTPAMACGRGAHISRGLADKKQTACERM